jgi:hypothetical protein
MKRRTPTSRRTAAVVFTAGMATGLIGAGWGGPAGAEISRRVPAVTAPPPPSGSGVDVIVEVPVAPEPIGPRSLT